MYGANESAVDNDGKLPRYVRITDITPEGFLTSEGKKGFPSEKVNEKNKLKSGDIVFARTGATVGKTYSYRPIDGE